MAGQGWKDFCAEVCRRAGVAPPVEADGSLPAMTLEYLGVSMVVSQLSQHDDSAGLLFADFGEVPPEREAEVFASLLQANFLMHGRRSPAFSLNPATGHVLCQVGFELEHVTPAEFCDSLDGMARAVRDWRYSFGVLADEAAPAMSAGAAPLFA